MPTTSPLTYDLADSIATITMDDGKANVMSLTMLEALADAFDRAEADRAVVVLTGRHGLFSAGYDLAVFDAGAAEIVRTLRAGGDIVHRIMSFPFPVVASCTGHAIAQGAFTLLAADVRIGAAGAFKIGLTIPHYGIEAARMRLTPAWCNHATITGAFYSPPDALVAGFLDRVVEAESLHDQTQSEARRLAGIDMTAHAATKLRVRASAIRAVRDGIDREFPAA